MSRMPRVFDVLRRTLMPIRGVHFTYPDLDSCTVVTPLQKMVMVHRGALVEWDRSYNTSIMMDCRRATLNPGLLTSTVIRSLHVIMITKDSLEQISRIWDTIQRLPPYPHDDIQSFLDDRFLIFKSVTDDINFCMAEPCWDELTIGCSACLQVMLGSNFGGEVLIGLCELPAVLRRMLKSTAI